MPPALVRLATPGSATAGLRTGQLPRHGALAFGNTGDFAAFERAAGFTPRRWRHVLPDRRTPRIDGMRGSTSCARCCAPRWPVVDRLGRWGCSGGLGCPDAAARALDIGIGVLIARAGARASMAGIQVAVIGDTRLR